MASTHETTVHPQPPQQQTLTFPSTNQALLTRYLPPPPASPPPPAATPYPFVTLTYAQSLDASIARRPGERTRLSGAESSAMTHFLRARHGAVLVGAGTAAADDPRLNCRFADPSSGSSSPQKQPRPVVLDARARWAVHGGSKVVEAARRGEGVGPWVVVGEGVVVDEERQKAVEAVGGRYLAVPVRDAMGGRFAWEDVLRVLKREGVDSVMVEGGGEVIKSLLGDGGRGFVDSVIVTVAPTWLGRGGVLASPPAGQGPDGGRVNLTDVTWCPLGEDVVMCGKIRT